MRSIVVDENLRADGRGTTEVRPITSRAGFLPRTHGSALFTRGETQAIAVATLGGNLAHHIAHRPGCSNGSRCAQYVISEDICFQSLSLCCARTTQRFSLAARQVARQKPLLLRPQVVFMRTLLLRLSRSKEVEAGNSYCGLHLPSTRPCSCNLQRPNFSLVLCCRLRHVSAEDGCSDRGRAVPSLLPAVLLPALLRRRGTGFGA